MLTIFLLAPHLQPVLAAPSTAAPLSHGVILAYPPGSMDWVSDLGFDWTKHFLYWSDAEPIEGAGYDWSTLDRWLGLACQRSTNVLLQVHHPPTWARAWAHEWAPVRWDKLTAWRTFIQHAAARIGEQEAACDYRFRAALEIWNEPNLAFQWGELAVDAAWYTAMAREAHAGAKAGYPHLIVVVGALAPTGGTPDGHAVDDVVYLERMYGAGLGGSFDVISVHNYGFGGPPESKTCGKGILNFRRAEDIRAVMVAHGDGDKPIWSTEFGWLLDAHEEGVDCDAEWQESGFAWQRVSAEQQADYLSRAFTYAEENWPWMEVMFVSNLDFSLVPWYTTCEPLRWFAILRPGGERPAYQALKLLPKQPKEWRVWGMDVEPTALHFIRDIGSQSVESTEYLWVENVGQQPFTWTVGIDTGGLPLTVERVNGPLGDGIELSLAATQLARGTYQAHITVTASPSDPPQSPWQIPVWLAIVERAGYLPIVTRGYYAHARRLFLPLMMHDASG